MVADRPADVGAYQVERLLRERGEPADAEFALSITIGMVHAAERFTRSLFTRPSSAFRCRSSSFTVPVPRSPTGPPPSRSAVPRFVLWSSSLAERISSFAPLQLTRCVLSCLLDHRLEVLRAARPIACRSWPAFLFGRGLRGLGAGAAPGPGRGVLEQDQEEPHAGRRNLDRDDSTRIGPRDPALGERDQPSRTTAAFSALAWVVAERNSARSPSGASGTGRGWDHPPVPAPGTGAVRADGTGAAVIDSSGHPPRPGRTGRAAPGRPPSARPGRSTAAARPPARPAAAAPRGSRVALKIQRRAGGGVPGEDAVPGVHHVETTRPPPPTFSATRGNRKPVGVQGVVQERHHPPLERPRPCRSGRSDS